MELSSVNEIIANRVEQPVSYVLNESLIKSLRIDPHEWASIPTRKLPCRRVACDQGSDRQDLPRNFNQSDRKRIEEIDQSMRRADCVSVSNRGDDGIIRRKTVSCYYINSFTTL
jgi:hypothetical protein